MRIPRRRVGASKHLNRIPKKAGAVPAACACGEERRRADAVGVLGLLAAVAVAVLEVEPQVLDRLRPQLGADPAGHLRR